MLSSATQTLPSTSGFSGSLPLEPPGAEHTCACSCCDRRLAARFSSAGCIVCAHVIRARCGRRVLRSRGRGLWAHERCVGVLLAPSRFGADRHPLAARSSAYVLATTPTPEQTYNVSGRAGLWILRTPALSIYPRPRCSSHVFITPSVTY